MCVSLCVLYFVLFWLVWSCTVSCCFVPFLLVPCRSVSICFLLSYIKINIFYRSFENAEEFGRPLLEVLRFTRNNEGCKTFWECCSPADDTRRRPNEVGPSVGSTTWAASAAGPGEHNVRRIGEGPPRKQRWLVKIVPLEAEWIPWRTVRRKWVSSITKKGIFIFLYYRCLVGVWMKS